MKLIRSLKHVAKGKHYFGYAELVAQLKADFPDGYKPVGEEEEKSFIRLFGSLLKSINVLQAFDQFEGKELLSDFPSKSSFQNMTNIHPNRHL